MSFNAMIRTLQTTGRWFARLEARQVDFAGLLLILLVILINVEVFARYVLGKSTLIADEYGGYLFVWIVMLGALNLLRSDRYLTMTWLVDYLGPAGRNMIGMISALIGLSVGLIALWASSRLVLTSLRFGSVSIQASGTPLALPQIILPTGYLLLCIAYIEELIRRVLGLEPRRNDDAAGGIG
jgi:TRAP-type C4-dicarboxylate transport system permease small subunit